jgi:choline dehydrogenase-like flavoprotein
MSAYDYVVVGGGTAGCVGTNLLSGPNLSTVPPLRGPAISGRRVAGRLPLLGPDDHAQIADAYGPNAARLLAAKTRFDPDRVFSATPLPPTRP